MKNTKRKLKVLLSALVLASVVAAAEPAVWAASSKKTEKSDNSVCTACKGNGICTNCNGFTKEFIRKGETVESKECSVCKGTGKCVVCNTTGKTASASKKPSISKKSNASAKPSASKKPGTSKKPSASKKPGTSKKSNVSAKPNTSKKSSTSKPKSKKSKTNNKENGIVQLKVTSKSFTKSGDTLVMTCTISNISDTYDLVALKKGTFYLKDKNGKVIYEAPMNKGLTNKIAHNCSVGYNPIIPVDSKVYKAEDLTPYIEAAWDCKKCEGKNCTYCKEFEKAQADKEAATDIDWSLYYDTERSEPDSNGSETGVNCFY